MSLQKFPVATLQKVSQYIRQNLALPESEQHPLAERSFDDTEDPPEPSSLDALGDLFRFGSMVDENLPAPNQQGRWFISTADPAAALAKLPGLSLRSGLRLVTYLCLQPEGGIGVTWALPEQLSSTANLEKALEGLSGGQTPPHPKGALPRLMQAIEGDHSHASFLTASILQRELLEFGRTGKYRRWVNHRFITAVPPQVQWQWQIAKVPTDFSPKVQILADQQAAVEFFTCRVTAPITIVRHLDHYPAGQYTPKLAEQVIAVAAAKP